MPLSHCPRCGKWLPAYQRFPQCSGCGWKPVPENPPWLPTIRRAPTPRDPWWYRWEYYQGLAVHYGVVMGWRVWRAWAGLSDQLGLTRAFYHRLTLFYLLWGLVSLLPFLEGFLWRDWRVIAGIPILLSWVLLYCCVRLVPFPAMKGWSRELRRWIEKDLLRMAPFFREYTVTGSLIRPQWVAIHWWVCLSMIVLGLLLGSFLLGLTGLILAVVSFVGLLF